MSSQTQAEAAENSLDHQRTVWTTRYQGTDFSGPRVRSVSSTLMRKGRESVSEWIHECVIYTVSDRHAHYISLGENSHGAGSFPEQGRSRWKQRPSQSQESWDSWEGQHLHSSDRPPGGNKARLEDRAAQ